jgi:hypothetical protein
MELMELNSLLLTNPVLIGLLSGVIGGVVGGSFSLMNTLISTKSQERREKQQWVRDKLQEIYTNCIFNLSLAEREFGSDYKEIENMVRESNKWLNLLLIYHPFKKDKKYEELASQLELFLEAGDKFRLTRIHLEESASIKRNQIVPPKREEVIRCYKEIAQRSGELKKQVRNLAMKDPRLG